MPTTRKQKKARKSRGLEILSDIENLDIMLSENHFDGTERDESLEGTSIRRQDSVTSNNLENEGLDPDADYGNPRVGASAVYGQNSASVDSQAEINKLSSELNSRISKKMDEMMNSVSSQIQRAINDAIKNQVLPQIQNVIMAGSGQETRRGWETSIERPEIYTEIQQNPKTKTNFSSEHSENHRKGDRTQSNVHDMVTGDNESPNPVPEFLTGRIPSRSHLNQSYEDINLDTTIPAHERIATAADPDPITRLADVLTTMQNRPTAQQLTIRPVNSNTMTFDGKSEKFELFEDLFHTMIKMQPEMTEQMKINHFHSLLRKNALQTVHENPPITLNKKTRALIENWQMNDGTNHPVFPNPLGTETHDSNVEPIPQSLQDEKQFQNVLITRDGEPDCIPLSTNINLKCKKRMLYFPMDFGELTIDGLIDTGALSSAIPEMDLRKIRLLSPQSVIREGPPPNFQIRVANGQLETPKSTIELKFEVGDIEFHEIFIVMEHLTGPIIGLMFLQRNHTVLDMRQGILNFPFFSMQPKTADHKYSNVLEPIFNPTEITIPPNDRVLIRTNSLLYPENAVTGILQPSDLLHEEGDITFCPALVTLNDGNIMIQVNNFTDHPYKLKKGLHIANFSVMTPEQMKYVKPVDPASTWHLLQNDQEQAAHYVSSLIKTNRNPQNTENYWFPTPENPGNPEEHTPIQKRILRELQALQDLETLDPTADAESRAKFLENFDWKDSTLTTEEKEKIEGIVSGIP